MARLIVKSPYIKCGAGQSAGGYLKYIATRERVEIIPDDRPPTNKQEQLIAKLVKDFPDAKELMEYEDYLSHPTKATASALITLTLESNWDRVQGMEGYRCGAVPFHFIQGTGGRKMYALEFRTANRHHTWLRCAICETKAPLERVRRGQPNMTRWRILRLPGTVQAACAKWRSVPLMRYGQKSA